MHSADSAVSYPLYPLFFFQEMLLYFFQFSVVIIPAMCAKMDNVDDSPYLYLQIYVLYLFILFVLVL